NLNVAQAVVATNNLNLSTGQRGNINLAASITGDASVDLNAGGTGGSGSITQSAGTIFTPNLTMTSGGGTGSGNIGSATHA
ncbi:hypothetical protein, partial [Klebsiella pneumoniae]|uniref:hypothetical protein n=1 Tax=Klebsiella pneumoniae TaxID=573 RepID=UPI003CEE8D3E